MRQQHRRRRIGTVVDGHKVVAAVGVRFDVEVLEAEIDDVVWVDLDQPGAVVVGVVHVRVVASRKGAVRSG